MVLRGSTGLGATEAGSGVNGKWQRISAPTTAHGRKTLSF